VTFLLIAVALVAAARQAPLASCEIAIAAAPVGIIGYAVFHVSRSTCRCISADGRRIWRAARSCSDCSRAA